MLSEFMLSDFSIGAVAHLITKLDVLHAVAIRHRQWSCRAHGDLLGGVPPALTTAATRERERLLSTSTFTILSI